MRLAGLVVPLAILAGKTASGDDKYRSLSADPATLQPHRTAEFSKSRIECGALCSSDASCSAFAYDDARDGPCELSDATGLASAMSMGKVKQVSVSKDVTPVDGNWVQWGEWSYCSCRTVNKTRTRACGTPSYGGQRVCPETGEAKQTAECGLPPCTYSEQFMVIGGHPSAYHNDIEILDLSSTSSICAKPADHPSIAGQRVGAYVDGEVVVCGGQWYVALDTCYSYNFTSDEWTLESYTLPTPTMYMSYTAMLPNGTWMILGGDSAETAVNLFQDGVMAAGPTMPQGIARACGVTLNNTHIYIGGGSSDRKRALIINVDTWEFTDLDDMAYNRYMPACGLIDNPDNGLEVVVAGGDGAETSSEILNLSNLTWRAGPALPEAVEMGQFAQLGTTFFLTPGLSLSRNLYKFDEINYGWILLDRQLSVGRYQVTMVPLPDGLGLCSEVGIPPAV